MIRNIKTLGLALVALIALTAVVASTASASKLTAGAASGKVTATQVGEQVFTTFPGTVKCTGSHQEGSYATATISEMTLTASYTGCTAFGFFGAKVEMNGCTYTVSGKDSEGKELPERTGSVQIVCPPEKEITVTTLTCTVHVEPQTVTGHIVFDNEAGPPPDVKATYTFEKIKYIETTGCPNVEKNTTTSDGVFTGSSTVKATNTAGGSVSLSAD